MHLISPLASGVRGAEDGTVDLFYRGTATRATWYESFEGDGPDSSGDPVGLDSDGRAIVYVSQLVDVVCKNVDGEEVARFTSGHSASNVEVRSRSATGTDYDDASTGTGSNFPVSLAELIDRWYTSAGAPDFKVLLGGQSTLLQVALGALVGAFYNVKSAAYGAVGDGATDDTAAIAAAITAATSAGGIVYFPPGTYRVTDVLSVPAKVSLLGCGSASSAILTDHATRGTISFSGAASYAPQTMTGLRVGAQQANGAGSRVSISAGAAVVIADCFIGGTNSNARAIELAGGSNTFFCCMDSTLTTAHGSGSVVGMSTTGNRRLHFARCVFIATSASYSPSFGMAELTECTVTDCIFDGSACTSGTFSYFYRHNTSVTARLRGCTFLATGGATATAIELGSYTATAVFEESESVFGASVTAYSYTAVHAGNTKGAIVRLNSRDHRRVEVTDNTATIAGLGTYTKQYGTVVIKRTTNVDQTVRIMPAAADVPPDASRTKLVIWNAAGSDIASELVGSLNGIDISLYTPITNQYAATFEFDTFILSGTSYAIAPTTQLEQIAYFA